jgi:hypothetical protein
MTTQPRPLAVVTVADATPMVLTNLRQLAQRVQRDSVLPILIRQPPNRVVLMLDSDEFLDPVATTEVIADIDQWEEPRRLGLVPLFGAIDRVARSIHCCWREPLAELRDPDVAAGRDYLVAAPSVARADQMVGRSPSRVRFGSKLLSRTDSFGVHLTMAEGSATLTAKKLANTRHTWDERVLREQHLNTMLSAGVHHAGWWIAGYREPEDWLLELAAQNNLRIAGPLQPQEQLTALRAWAEARLDPRIPDSVVEAVDNYVADRRADADDFLLPLNDYLMARMPTGIGQPADPQDCSAEASK